ncbi:hypothetical protein HK097_011613 [Rhizophlyctis rosea]|uniref:Flavodoxin-like domain-containing protein n=1 Tax=Rhizophlyctis rosea TaxID=64517 RepID=A0AAD5SNT9_9FUNG|nr:hypothetical protein HK097_011613 [Rhizophlyctis rosea]
MVAKVAIIYYSMYGHIGTLAKEMKKGLESVGVTGDLFRIPETLTQDVLDKMHAPPKPADIPEATLETLEEYDAFLFGIPTRYGNQAAQVRAFWDRTGGLWAKGALRHKVAGVFVSTASLGGGQENTVSTFISTLVHHGVVYVPLGYADTFAQFTGPEYRGGSAWGAGTLAGPDGSRQPSALELEVASIQGKKFGEFVSRLGPVKAL